MSLLSFNQTDSKSKDKDAKVRPMAVAGSFYPVQKDSITKLMDSYFAPYTKTEPKEQIAAVIVPHAGYIFSGSVAASAFAQIPTGSKFDHIFLIGPSHHVYLDGASINSQFDYYATPLGEVKVDVELCKQLIRDHQVFVCNEQAHKKEHCLEVQLPFLQYRMKEMAPIIPIIIGAQSLETIKKIAEALRPYFNEKNLFVISSDFSHYPSYADAKEVDETTGRAIESGKLNEFMDALEHNKDQHVENLATSACGQSAIALLLYLTQPDKNIQINHLLYRNSGDSQYGGKEEVVGYHAFTFVRKKEIEAKTSFNLSEKEKHTLLAIARNSISNELNRHQGPSCSEYELSETLKMKCGAFVTLDEEGQLRGCIGHFGNDTPLYRIIEKMAKASAFEDPRFMPLQRYELENINIEISVLSPLKRIHNINEFEYGKEGIYISKGRRSGTFLPQVAQETNWTKEEFLGHCARDKAGLSWDGWKDAELYTYEAIIFKEEKQ